MKFVGILGLAIISITRALYFTEQNITSGITFINETSGSISYQRWNALYYYSLKNYLDQTVLFENAIEEMRKTCKLLQEEGSICTTLIIRLEKYREKIEQSREIIRKFGTEGRYKRSIPMFGGLLLALFSTMAADQAKIYNDIIEQVEGNLKTHQELRQEQLSVFKDSLTSNDNRFDELTNRINFLTSHALMDKNMTNDVSKGAVRENFNFLIQTATLIMIDHNRISDTIIELLTNASLDKITTLIPTSKFIEDLRMIGYALNADKKLPIDINTENIYELFRIMTVKTTIINNRLLIVITIPIVNVMTYDIFRAIPIPTRVNDDAVIIQPSSDYFLMNKKASHFIPLTSEEYAKCTRKSNDHIICAPSSPIFIGRHTKCEIGLFNEIDLKDLNTHCKYNLRKIQQQNYFVRLGSPNLFYIYIHKPIVVRFLCDGREPTEILLNQNGMLALDDKCVMQSEGFIIEASYDTGFESKYLLESPDFNISDLASLKHIVKRNTDKSKDQEENGKDVTLLENYDVEFNDLQKRVEELQDLEREIVLNQREVNDSPLSGLSWIYVSIALMILLVIGTKLIQLFHCMCQKII